MDAEQKAAADARFERALAARGARDPREFYRDRMRELRERDPAAFKKAVEYFETTLIPAVAQEGDPVDEWLEYGRFLASLLQPGNTVQIDPTGKAVPYARPAPADHLILHLPTSTREPALAVGIPAQLSSPQRATYDLLVLRRAG